MNQAMEQIRALFDNVVYEYKFIDKRKIGLWIAEGDYLDSRVETIIEDEEINYEIKYFINKNTEKGLTAHELFVFLHEMGHIIILEEMRNKNDVKEVENYLRQYEKELEELDEIAEKENWDDKKLQEEYENILFEKETDIKAKELFDSYIKIASS